MKVAFVNQPWNLATLRAQSGSIALITHNLAKRLADSCEVIVYARHRQPGARREKQGRLEYRYLSMVEDWPPLRLLERSVKLRRPLAATLLDKVFDKVRPHFWSSNYYLSFIARVAAQLRAERCDVIHLHNLSQFPVIVGRFNPQAVIALHIKSIEAKYAGLEDFMIHWAEGLSPKEFKKQLRWFARDVMRAFRKR